MTKAHPRPKKSVEIMRENEKENLPERIVENTVDAITGNTDEKLWNKNYLKVWTANFMIFFSFWLVQPLFPLYLQQAFGADKETIGIVLSGYTLTALLIRPFSGFFVDSFPRKVVLLISYFVFAAFFFGYIIAGTLTLFAIVRTLHGIPFGAVTVANSTVAIDVLPAARRAEGIGYYGLSNNVATAIAPTIALWMFAFTDSYTSLFIFSLIVAFGGFAINTTLRLRNRPLVKKKEKLSFDRFIMLKGWSQSLCLICFASSFGVLSTYVAIYGADELGITGGTGLFFMFFAIGLILSRITGSRSLHKGLIARNATVGCLIALIGFIIFAGIHNPVGYYLAPFIIGLGNGHMFPAFQSIFINLTTNERRGTANSTLLVSWDIGVGIGIFAGGMVSERYGFHAAFWWGALVNAIGVVLYLAYAKGHYLRNRLR